METIGGGIILDSNPSKHINRNESLIISLKIREHGSIDEIALLAANEINGVFSILELCKRADIDKENCRTAIEALLNKGSITQLLQDRYISNCVLGYLGDECKSLLESYHRSFPLRAGINIAELRQKIFKNTDTAESNAILKIMQENGTIKLSGNAAALPDYTIIYSPAQNKIHAKILSELTTSVYDVKSPEELSTLFSKNEKRDFEQVFESMISNGDLIMLSPQVYWLNSNYDKAIGLIKKHFENKDDITLAECRDILGTSRKYALAFLEHLDGKQVTKLHGDTRKLAKGF